MSFNQNLISSLGILLGGVGLISAIKATTQPLTSDLRVSILPDTVKISNWDFTQSRVVEPASRTESYDRLLQGRSYQFETKSQQLKLQLGYFFNTNGDVLVLQDQITTMANSVKDSVDLSDDEINWTTHLDPNGNSYLLSQANSGDQVLLTCINPQGKNTATRTEFLDNRLSHDVNVNQVFRWLMGRSQFLDKRCLWTRLSLSQADTPESSSDKLLDIMIELQPQLNSIF